MCLIVVAHRAHPEYRLVVAANRDEWFDRAAAPAAFWADAPGVLAGRDLRAGGTWLGVTRAGRFAALTNFRDPSHNRPDAPSRGALVGDYLTGSVGPDAYLGALRPRADRYNGFNLIVGDAERLMCFSNRDGETRDLSAGIFGLSNALLDTPWPKVESAKRRLGRLLADAPTPDALVDLMSDTTTAPDHALPSTGVPLDWERALSPLRILTSGYGTRCTTALTIDRAGRVAFVERTYGADGEAAGTVRETFTLVLGA
jgi:uncharacterized protein with NRDE domain